MKSDFKELFNSFDENDFDDDFMNLNDIDVCDDTAMDVDIAKIKADVFESIGTKKKRKNTTKKLRMLLIAAVVVIGITIFSTVIYASGSVQLVFGEFLNGNMSSAGLYEGENITYTSSDPNLNVELLGVTGDKRRIYTVLEVTKKDGSTFTEEGYDYPFWLKNEGESLWDYYECYASYTDKYNNYFGPSPDGISYLLSEDKKALKMMFLVSAQDKDLQGATLTIHSKSFGARKMLEPYSRKYTFAEEYDKPQIEMLYKELGIDESNWGEVYNGEYYEYGYIDDKKYELPFELSFTINIGDDKIKQELTTENAPNFVEPIADEVTMEITSFGINIYCETNIEDYLQTDYKKYEETCHKPLDCKRSEIIMDDGTEYFLYYFGDCVKGVVKDGEDYYYKEEIILSLSKVPGGMGEPEINLIDTSKIRTVIINDNIVYSNKK